MAPRGRPFRPRNKPIKRLGFESTLRGLLPTVAEPEWSKPDIIEWICSDAYLDRGATLYPRQATLLKLIFLAEDLLTEYDYDVLGEWSRGFRLPEPGEVPPDEYRYEPTRGEAIGLTPDWHERMKLNIAEGRPWFREVLPLIGRRGSKGHIGGLAGSRVLGEYISMGDPQERFGIARDKKLVGMVFAGKKEQAKVNQWRDLVDVVIGSPYLSKFVARSLGESLTMYAPSDARRIRELAAKGLESGLDMATFEIVPKESTLMAGRGPTSFCQFYDEMAHVIATGANRSAEEVYGACLDPSTRVLTADLGWVPLSEVKVGDRLVSMDEQPSGITGAPRRLREAEVLATMPSRSGAYRVGFEDGTSVVCSGNHRWLRSRQSGNFTWATIEIPEVRNSNSWASLKVGDCIRQIATPWDRIESHDAGYLAGMLDGEGHVSFAQPRGSCRIGFTQKPGPVMEKVAGLLDQFGFNYTRSPQKQSGCEVLTVAGVGECFRLVDQVGAIRLRENLRTMWQGRTGGRRGAARRIVSIEAVGDRDLLDIQTSTGTFIAEGLVSHNSTPALDQFGVYGFIYTGSSPWQMSGQLYENYLQALSADPATGAPIRPEILMLQLRSWDLYLDWEYADTLPLVPGDHKRTFSAPMTGQVLVSVGERDRNGVKVTEVRTEDDGSTTMVGDKKSPYAGRPFNKLKGAIQVYDDQMKRLEAANPESFRVERLSQWATAMDAYLDRLSIEAMFRDENNKRLPMLTKGALSTEYYAHGDPSESGDNFGFAIGHRVGPDENGMYGVRFDYIHAWLPSDYPDSQIDYIAIEQEIIEYGKAFGFSQLTFDQFGGPGTIQRIRSALAKAGLPRVPDVRKKTATAAINWEMAETFKTAMNMGLVKAPYHELLELELRFLQKSGTQRVDHPSSGPVQTKDVADAVFNVVHELIGEQMGAYLKDDLASSKLSGSQPGGLPTSQNQERDVFDRLGSSLPRVRPGTALPPSRRRAG